MTITKYEALQLVILYRLELLRRPKQTFVCFPNKSGEVYFNLSRCNYSSSEKSRHSIYNQRAEQINKDINIINNIAIDITLILFKSIMFDNISNNGIETITMDSKHNVNLLNLLIDITLLVKPLENDLLEQSMVHSHL